VILISFLYIYNKRVFLNPITFWLTHACVCVYEGFNRKNETKYRQREGKFILNDDDLK
jgi:hypothetical protein